MKRQHSFTHNGLTITVHTRTGGDELAQEVIYAGMIDYADSAPTVLWHQANTYSQIVTQTDSIDGEADFVLPSPLASTVEHKVFFASLMDRTDGLVKAWRKALDAVDAAPVAQTSDDPKGEPLQSGTPASTLTIGSSENTPTSPPSGKKS